jgi:RNA polymerase sigma-70 factor, ECF subfamily
MSEPQTLLSTLRLPRRSQRFSGRARNRTAGRTRSSSSKPLSSDAALSFRSDAKLSLHPAEKQWGLVQQAMDGDSRAQEHVFACDTAMLRRKAFTILRNTEDAEDAVQDALCKAFERLRFFQGRSSFSTWLTRIVINSALMIRRRRTGRPETSLDEILDSQPERLRRGIVDAGPSPEEVCRIAEINGIVDEQIQRLRPALRAALQLGDFYGLSAAESSQALGIRKSAFKSRICRARQKVANALRESLGTPISRISPAEAI